MTKEEKIELFNKLQKELQSIYGEFNTIQLVDEYTADMNVDDGIHYYDTSGCMESTPICIAVKRGE